MPGSKQIPASLRYLKARLKILERPSFWGAVSVLLIAGWFLSEYWNRSLDPMTATGDRLRLDAARDLDAVRDSVTTQPTPLDPLSTVDQPSSEATPNFLTDLPSASSSSSDSSADALLPNLTVPDSTTSANRSRSSSWHSPFSASSITSNPDLSQVPDLNTINLLPSSSNLRGSTLSGESGASESDTSQTNSAPANRAPANPLQAALDRYATDSPSRTSRNSAVTSQPSPSGSSPTTTSTDPAATAQGQIYAPLSLPGQAPLPQPLPGQPAPYQTLTQPVYIPQTSPPVGSTGYTPPPIFQTNPSSATGMSNTGIGNSYSGLTAAPRSVATPSIPNTASPPQIVQPAPASAPFSIPRSVPGQSIGGGQINTFSNP